MVIQKKASGGIYPHNYATGCFTYNLCYFFRICIIAVVFFHVESKVIKYFQTLEIDDS